MKINKNILKQQLLNGETRYGLWSALQGSDSAELLACTGYDWILLDGEHAPKSIHDIQTQLQAIAPYDAQAIVRPVNADVDLIGRILDAGAQSILIPNVDSVEKAENIAKASRYPTRGVRGVSTVLTRAARWGMTENYLADADDEILVIGQIESANGVKHLDAILEVDGIHGFFIGPADLSASMGYIGQASHPEVQKTIADCLQRIQAAGKFAGIFATSKELHDRYQAMGATMIALGSDTSLLAKSARTLLDSVR